ncbi:exosortase A [Massilia agilis]|uniref:Exosortase A n=1 Tax=Massilia agilis TaxID=1811226 RepID=A0ABT2DDE1_9BURK|nr:exosortase A [Massilia agilis]MCS0809153.1 exosortase A [Massilia agilis]
MLTKAPTHAIRVAQPGAARGALLLAGLCLLAPFFLYLSTVQSIVAVWNSSDTFAHGYAILPISAWLVWRRRENFTYIPVAPWWPGLAALALAGAGWLLATVGEVQVVRQYAFVSMIPLGVLALLGPRLAASLAFPLLFLLFAVPFGEIFVQPLINFTADFTVAAVRASGIPVLRTGARFELPTGTWSVVEACSGIRYLISSITLGCLYAYLTYRSMTRRAMFVALSVVVPIVANGLRAYMIVMIGHLSGMKLATGVDHLIYGWLFFGLVMFIMFWIGSYWREDEAQEPAARSSAPAAQPAVTHAAPGQMARMAAYTLLLAALWPALAQYNEHANANPAPVRLHAPQVAWPATPMFTDWSPRFLAPSAGYSGAWRAPGLQPVGLTVLYYRDQDSSRSLVSSLNKLTNPNDAWHWTASGTRTEAVAGRPLALTETTLQSGKGSLLVWQWMWVGGQYTTSAYKAKLLQARSKLLLRGDDGAALLLYAPFTESPEEARRAMRAFLSAHGDAIGAALADAKGG